MVNKKKKVSKAASSPFTKKELASVRAKLVKKKAQILEDFIKIEGDTLNKSYKDASGDLSGYAFHMADMATDLYDREFSLGLAEEERERLFALDDALKRVDEGIYGLCDSCGVKISKQRLKVMPQAKNCIKCQEEEEKSTG
ncbi:MAG: TraR/DksA C4-type zinc finger protein [Candidatus Omnitrophica bacterium]|nr:TraR/DksA C4-type zinc finger protein [Candidatus Omnitrophota bacterium]